MANKLQAQVAGGDVQANQSASTVGELAKKVGAEGYVATVNGEPADNNQELNDYEFVSFAKPVKAG